MFFSGGSQISQGVGVWCNSRRLPARLVWVKPRVWVDGVELGPVAWGRIEVPLPVGRHRLQVGLPYLKDPGANIAEREIVVEPGRVTEVMYTEPQSVFLRASLKPAPSENPRQTLLIAGLIAAFLLLVVLSGVVVFAF